MAQILLNGGESKTSLRILHSPPQKLVTAYRELDCIRHELESFRQRFSSVPAKSEAVYSIIEVGNGINSRYSRLLESCADMLMKEAVEMSPNSRAYYLPVLVFLSRASNSHSILPFMKYLGEYAADLSISERRNIQRENASPSFRGFIKERIAESLRICEAYRALMSNSLDSSMRFFSLGEILHSILNIQRQLSEYNRGEPELHRKGVSFIPEPTGDIFGIPSLAYFLIHQVISNAFKATFVVRHALKQNGRTLSKEYSGMPELDDPRITVSLNSSSVDSVAIAVCDNGIGVPEGRLGELVAVNWESVYFGTENMAMLKTIAGVLGDASERREYLRAFNAFTVSAGSSVSLFPFISDLLGVDMVLSSSGIGKGFRAEIVFPVDLALKTREQD
ncbi:TPA: hypothetical protein HA238_01600 [Candidatus Micrarchaeota archaeon]|nr:hypothetical protein [Candidatus Micrarchaeota archaeon]